MASCHRSWLGGKSRPCSSTHPACMATCLWVCFPACHAHLLAMLTWYVVGACGLLGSPKPLQAEHGTVACVQLAHAGSSSSQQLLCAGSLQLPVLRDWGCMQSS